jgi:uncharacterized membrane protein
MPPSKSPRSPEEDFEQKYRRKMRMSPPGSRLRSVFIQGLAAFVPIALSAYILVSVVKFLDSFLGTWLESLVGRYIPGLGLFLTLVLILVLGFALNNLIARGFWFSAEKWIMRAPLLSVIYQPLKDLTNLFSKSGPKGMHAVVLVSLNQNGMKSLGLVTREDFADIEGLNKSETKAAPDFVSVYIPMSFGFGGFTLLVQRNQLEFVDIPVDKALKLAFTGWVKVENNESTH